MKLMWLSDIHLNFLTADIRKDYYNYINKNECDAVLITGDIAESHNVSTLLSEMYEAICLKKIYFVAGNHDYYGASIKEMKKEFSALFYAHYLPRSSYVKLTKETALVGQDGWGDCRNGSFEHSRLRMADWTYIKELKAACNNNTLKETLQKLADKDAERVCKSVVKALSDKNVKKVIIATHVPPFEEACLYAGQKSTESGLPFFSSYILGFSILPIVEANPHVEFVWLSGHTHSRVTVQKRDNFIVKVAESKYFRPGIEEIIVA